MRNSRDFKKSKLYNKYTSSPTNSITDLPKNNYRLISSNELVIPLDDFRHFLKSNNSILQFCEKYNVTAVKYCTDSTPSQAFVKVVNEDCANALIKAFEDYQGLVQFKGYEPEARKEYIVNNVPYVTGIDPIAPDSSVSIPQKTADDNANNTSSKSGIIKFADSTVSDNTIKVLSTTGPLIVNGRINSEAVTTNADIFSASNNINITNNDTTNNNDPVKKNLNNTANTNTKKIKQEKNDKFSSSEDEETSSDLATRLSILSKELNQHDDDIESTTSGIYVDQSSSNDSTNAEDDNSLSQQKSSKSVEKDSKEESADDDNDISLDDFFNTSDTKSTDSSKTKRENKDNKSTNDTDKDSKESTTDSSDSTKNNDKKSDANDKEESDKEQNKDTNSDLDSKESDSKDSTDKSAKKENSNKDDSESSSEEDNSTDTDSNEDTNDNDDKDSSTDTESDEDTDSDDEEEKDTEQDTESESNTSSDDNKEKDTDKKSSTTKNKPVKESNNNFANYRSYNSSAKSFCKEATSVGGIASKIGSMDLMHSMATDYTYGIPTNYTNYIEDDPFDPYNYQFGRLVHKANRRRNTVRNDQYID